MKNVVNIVTSSNLCYSTEENEDGYFGKSFYNCSIKHLGRQIYKVKYIGYMNQKCTIILFPAAIKNVRLTP